jgi:hypothetical protein
LNLKVEGSEQALWLMLIIPAAWERHWENCGVRPAKKKNLNYFILFYKSTI